MFPPLTININGRILSFKNSKQIFVVRDRNGKVVLKNGAPIVNVVTNKAAAICMRHISEAGIEARRLFWDNQMLPNKTLFSMNVELIVSNWTAPDGDGSLSTIMDSLQGVLFENDRYCVQGSFNKIVTKEKLECAVITITPLI